MNILTIDTVLDKTYLSVLLNNKEIYKQIESDEKNYHSAYLIKVLDEILKSENSSLKDIDYIGANTGVGSFTGIRAGLSIAKIISNRLNIKAVPITTIEVLSRAYKNNNIMLDARRNSVFYSKDGQNIEMVSFSKGEEILENSDEIFICDNSLYDKMTKYQNKLTSFEKNGKNLEKAELEIAKEKIAKNEVVNFAGLKPTYIQTPPIFLKS